jgi:hypothetical protein
LSGSDLKKIALFGCPSLEKKNVFAAKKLRKFFEIQENTVSQFPITFHLISSAFFFHLIIQGEDYNVPLVFKFSAHPQVCSKCVLKQSCKFVNQSVWKGDTKNLNLAVVMRVLILYALEWVPVELAVPIDIKASVNKLLKEVLKLSQSTVAEHTSRI